MIENIDTLIERMKEFDAKHSKVILESKKEEIRKLYEDLKEELEDEANFNLVEETESSQIKIESKCYLTFDDAGNKLNILIGMANYMEIKPENDKIIICLWFRCFEQNEK